MKENYLKLILLLIIAVIAIEGYYIYDIYRPKIKNEPLVYLYHRAPLVFDENENPFEEMERLQRKMQKSFKEIENYFGMMPFYDKFTLKSYRIPPLDMKEQNGKYIITMEIPGSLKDAIETKVENGRLYVSAKISEEKDDNTTNYYRHERYAGSYRHEVALPSDADASSLQKEYKDGLLTITLNKKNPS